jgi:hypothetical protein
MKQIFTSLLIFTLCFCKTGNLFAQVNVGDSLALVDFYDSTNGVNWKHHDNWLTPAPVSTWYGVGVSNGRVISLNLYNNKVVGKIPSSLGNLSRLQTLICAGNRIKGSIPSSLGNLLMLQTLELDGNLLSDSIPSSLGNLSKLQTLWCSQNNIMGSIPSSLGNLSSLHTLGLDFNQLTGNIPSSLGNLSHLTQLSLSYNNLSGALPVSLGNLSNLQTLLISNNQLSDSMPASLGNLSSLKDLVPNNNQLSGSIPESFGNLSKVFSISIDHNQLSGTIPSSLDSLSRASFHLDYNKFTFSGMEGLVQSSRHTIVYAPQSTLPIIKSGKTLSANAGGTLSNNTYNWYKDWVLVSTKVGDSTFKTTGAGNYNVLVTNSIATALTLYSDTITVTSSPGTENMISKAANTKTFIYPNPANVFINLKLDKPANSNTYVMIYDMQHKIIMQRKIATGALTQQYSINNLLPGNYTLILIENGKRTHKEPFTVAR